MASDIKFEKDVIRRNLNKYTRRAFQMLPKLDKPCILDVGCGSGVPTMELATLSNGRIIGFDTDSTQLEKLTIKISESGLSDRIEVMNLSMHDMDFPDEKFDIIWCEGSIFVVGFERGLREWRRFIKPKGFLVVHDENKETEKRIELIPNLGYDLVDHFYLSQDTWMNEYYIPLEKEIHRVRAEQVTDEKLLRELDKEQKEIDMVKKNPGRCSSVYFIMQKRDE
jgi:ubiquinone/menaquinone biosynthesis C-methylase UbiE